MRPIKTKSTSQVLMPPGDWDEKKQGKCVGLPIIREADGRLNSVWEPSEVERAAIAKGGNILLTVWGYQHPPVGLNVIKPGYTDYEKQDDESNSSPTKDSNDKPE